MFFLCGIAVRFTLILCPEFGISQDTPSLAYAAVSLSEIPSCSRIMTTIPGFLTKTYEIFNTADYTDCCGWGNNGSTIVIKKVTLSWDLNEHTSFATIVTSREQHLIFLSSIIFARLNSFRRAFCRSILNTPTFNLLFDS